MLKKSVIALIAVSFIVAQAAVFAPRPKAAENGEMLELATGLPESDVVLAMDFDRTLNVAAAGILDNDPQKIENLKTVMKTVENQIGLSPYEIKQIAVGIKLPPGELKSAAEGDLDFAAIVRTRLPNTNLLDVWSKRMENILAFNREKAPTGFYVEEFRRFRDQKFPQSTPEKIKARASEFDAALVKTRALGAALDALPKTTVAPAAVGDVRKTNQEFAAALGKLAAALKADADTKEFRAASIKLLNRWNALALDDPQRSAKLAAIRKESQALYPAYKKKFDAARKIEDLLERLDGKNPFDAASEPLAPAGDALDALLAAIKALPATKIKRTAALEVVERDYLALRESWSEPLAIAEAVPEPPVVPEPEPPVPTKNAKGFADLWKETAREQTVNGKRMLVIDVAKLILPSPEMEKPKPEPAETEKTKLESTEKTAEKPTPAKTEKIDEDSEDVPPPVKERPTPTTVELKAKPSPNLAVGYLDETRMVIGFEKSVAAVLKQDAAYRNQKAAAMLETGKTALFAFAVSSTVAKKISDEMTGPGANRPAPSMLDGFIKDLNLYGSVNFEGENNATNDITMTLGFARETVAPILPAPAAATGDETDSTFEIGGFQIGKALFYDLFNSFKAVQASVTVKFEKKKLASLLKSTPRIFDNLAAGGKTATGKRSKEKPRRADSVQELITAPQVYLDLVKLLTEKAE